MRLDKFISYALDVSRDNAKKIIKSKEITINGRIVNSPSFNVDANLDKVMQGDRVLEYNEHIYLMMNKPSGYLSATLDRNKTVIDLVDEYKKYNIFIVGRLDIDSVGLLILTNDGELAHRITSPKSNIVKKYYVEVDGKFEASDIQIFKDGMVISDGKGRMFKTLPALLEIINDNSAYISITEGKFHQVKYMCEFLGKKVKYLKRNGIGPLELDNDLEEGKYRKLTKEEIDSLKLFT